VEGQVQRHNNETDRRIGELVRSLVRTAVLGAAARLGWRVEVIEPPQIECFGSTPDSITARVDVTHDFNTRSSLFVKVGPPVVAENAGYDMLEELKFPHIWTRLYAEGSTLVLPWALNYRTLADEIASEASDVGTLKSLVRDILIKLASLWGSTGDVGKASPGRYRARLEERTQENFQLFHSISVGGEHLPLRALVEMPIRLNGEQLPPLICVKEEACRALVRYPPSMGVVSHGDLHPANVLARIVDGVAMDWRLIDLVNVTDQGDFAWEIAKLVHYLEVYCIVDQWKSMIHAGKSPEGLEVVVRNGDLAVDYPVERLRPAVSNELSARVFESGERFAEGIEDSGWRHRYAAHLFSVLWGGVRHHPGYPELVPVLMAEAVRLFGAAKP